MLIFSMYYCLPKVKEHKTCTVNSRYNVFFGTTEKKRYIIKILYQEFILNVGLHTDMYGTQWIEHVINILLQLLNQIHTPVIAMCSGIN